MVVDGVPCPKRSGSGRRSIDVFVADVDLPMVHRVSPGSAADDPEGQKLMEKVPKKICKGNPLIRDKAYEGDSCRAKAVECGMTPVVLPRINRTQPWEYDEELYKGRNVVERNFRKIKQFRRVFTRYENWMKPTTPSSSSRTPYD